jgi:hypothetical protein
MSALSFVRRNICGDLDQEPLREVERNEADFGEGIYALIWGPARAAARGHGKEYPDLVYRACVSSLGDLRIGYHNTSLDLCPWLIQFHFI